MTLKRKQFLVGCLISVGTFIVLLDFSYLNYDIAVLFEGYDDLVPGNVNVGRHGDAVFRWFKYLPILPMIASEKMGIIRSRGHLDDVYRGKKFNFDLSAKERIQV